MQSARIASLPEVVKLLRTLSGNSEEVSVIELAEVIQNDPLIMSKVIGAANMFAYNPNGVPISGVHQAIHVIGFERIRTLAMSIMLAEQVSRTHSPEVQREYAAQSLMAGCLAQTLAGGLAMLDKEQAFICASLRNFGQVILTSCMAEEFLQLRTAAGGEPDDASYRQAFGLTPLELGRQLLDAANLPKEILDTLRAIPPEAFKVLERKPDDQMRALTAFAGELAAITFDVGSDPADFPARSAELARRYEHVLPNLDEQIHPLMEKSTAQLDEIVRTFRIKSLPMRMMNRMVRCRNMVDPNRTPLLEPETPSAPAGAKPVAGGRVTFATVATPRPKVWTPTPEPPASADPAAHDWDGSLNRLADYLNQPGLARMDVHAALLDLVRAGFGAQHCLLFSTEKGSKSFPLTHGLGSVYTDLRSLLGLQIVTGERTVLGVCLTRNENIIVHHARDESILPHLPGWLKGQNELEAFVLLPLSDGARVGGVLLVGWAMTRQIELSPECVQSVRSMLALVCRFGAPLAA